jgi:hypothetical protein
MPHLAAQQVAFRSSSFSSAVAAHQRMSTLAARVLSLLATPLVAHTTAQQN